MTLNQYIAGLIAFRNKNPQCGEMPVAYASDDEGNSYHLVHSGPTPVEMEDTTTHYLEVVLPEKGETPQDNCIIIN